MDACRCVCRSIDGCGQVWASMDNGEQVWMVQTDLRGINDIYGRCGGMYAGLGMSVSKFGHVWERVDIGGQVSGMGVMYLVGRCVCRRWSKGGSEWVWADLGIYGQGYEIQAGLNGSL